jgi:hypothetical protein
MTGFPDVNVCVNGVTKWIELKVVTAKRTLLRKEQFAWALRRSVHHDPVILISWNEQTDEIMIWTMVVGMIVRGYSKYLEVVTEPNVRMSKRTIPIKTILFQGVTK